MTKHVYNYPMYIYLSVYLLAFCHAGNGKKSAKTQPAKESYKIQTLICKDEEKRVIAMEALQSKVSNLSVLYTMVRLIM